MSFENDKAPAEHGDIEHLGSGELPGNHLPDGAGLLGDWPEAPSLLPGLSPEDLVVLEEIPQQRAVPTGPRSKRRPKRGRGRQRVPAEEARRRNYTPEQRLLILDTWLRSALPAKDFAPLVGVSKHSLYDWKKKFERDGPAGLEDKVASRRGSRLNEVTKRAILLMKTTHPDWGQDRIHDMLKRSAGLQASAGAIGRVLDQAGYVVVEERTRPR